MTNGKRDLEYLSRSRPEGATSRNHSPVVGGSSTKVSPESVERTDSPRETSSVDNLWKSCKSMPRALARKWPVLVAAPSIVLNDEGWEGEV
ncbi:hypothetical protein IMZ48_34100 [Candidatus Bathyarchaeota archaeon]|nr:hypothetical protein [Candidatus Bathyarchaeota archaeon]